MDSMFGDLEALVQKKHENILKIERFLEYIEQNKELFD
jgi:hypothetical protein